MPSWRRRAGPVPGGHRFGRRLIPGNKTLQPVPSEPFVPRPRKGHFRVAKCCLNRTSTGTNMPHRELLTESQRLSLHAPASDERGMVRHHMLTSEDLALINRRRDPNRLGYRYRGYTREAATRPNRRLSRKPTIPFLKGCRWFPGRNDWPSSALLARSGIKGALRSKRDAISLKRRTLMSILS